MYILRPDFWICLVAVLSQVHHLHPHSHACISKNQGSAGREYVVYVSECLEQNHQPLKIEKLCDQLR